MYNSQRLLQMLQSDVRQLILETGRLEQEPAAVLEQIPGEGKWSIAQVLEHLNIYSRYYGNAIEQQLHLHQTQPQILFNPGWLGNYFTRMMQPRADQTIARKMKAPKNALPSAQPDGKEMLRECIAHQHRLLGLLQVAKTADLGSIRIPTSLNRFITLKLGDTFRFFIAHEQRHFLQINRVLREMEQVNLQAA